MMRKLQNHLLYASHNFQSDFVKDVMIILFGLVLMEAIEKELIFGYDHTIFD